MNSRLWVSITLLVAVFVLVVRSSSRNALAPETGSGNFGKNESAGLGSEGLPQGRKPTQLFDGGDSGRAIVPPDISEVPELTSAQRASALEVAEVFRSEVKAKRNEKNSRIRSLAGYSQRIAIRSGEGRYEYIPGLFALPQAEAIRLGINGIDRAAGYVFFEVSPGQVPPEQSLPAVINATTTRPGVVTGVLTVEYKGEVDNGAVARDFRLQPVQSFDHLKVGILKTERPLETDLVGLLRAVQSDKRVSSAALEIVEFVNVPR